MMKLALVAAAALLAVPNALCCYMSDTDFPGNDVDRIEGRVYSARECQRLCQGLSTCERWTYQPTTKSCYLKSGAGGPTFASGLVSGPRICPGPVDCSREGIDLYGGDLVNTTVANPRACQYQCSAVAGCAFWTFITESGTCYLKSSRVEPRELAGAVSGPRVCSYVDPIPCEASTDFLGYDLRSFDGTVTDASQCQQLCRGFNNCFYWTYVQSTNSCYLKDEHATEGREVNELTFSGARDCDLTIDPTNPITTTTTTPPPTECLLTDVDFQGADLFSFGFGAVTRPESCQLLCQYTLACSYFTFYNGTCYFKGQNAPNFATQKEGAVSGPKFCNTQKHPHHPHHSTTTTTTPPTTTAPNGDGVLKFLKPQQRN